MEKEPRGGAGLDAPPERAGRAPGSVAEGGALGRACLEGSHVSVSKVILPGCSQLTLSLETVSPGGGKGQLLHPAPCSHGSAPVQSALPPPRLPEAQKDILFLKVCSALTCPQRAECRQDSTSEEPWFLPVVALHSLCLALTRETELTSLSESQRPCWGNSH